MHHDLEQQFLAAYDEYADAIFRFCCAYAGERELARDATQEAFIRTWKYLASGRRIKEIRPFLYTTARNTIIDRKRRPFSSSLDQLRKQGFDTQDDQALDPAIAAESARAIQVIATLDEQYRIPLFLRHVEGLMPREIARITGASENVTSVRINRGMQQLRTLLGISSS